MRLFVDTSAWLALSDRNDRFHKEAVAKGEEIRKKRVELVTSEYVFDESITLIRYRVSHKAAVAFGEALFESRIARVADVLEEDRLRAWEIFKRYGDKEFSFTDCTSFALVQKMGIGKAFAFDADFRKMGIELF